MCVLVGDGFDEGVLMCLFVYVVWLIVVGFVLFDVCWIVISDVVIDDVDMWVVL